MATWQGVQIITTYGSLPRFFTLPPEHSSIVYMPDGTTIPATQVFVKVYPNGKVHAYPAP